MFSTAILQIIAPAAQGESDQWMSLILTLLYQTALAMAALAVAFADTLKELLPPDDQALVTLQRKVQVAQAKLRQTPDPEAAVAILRFVGRALGNPDIIRQPED